ncbi:MAG: hypothetical protein JXA81_05840 [Sedimentisphaerales bacterium]|nr:hypothetical protein [Sedimentisphaerales bacterium]
MCRRLMYLILLMVLFAGVANAQFITSVAHRNTDTDAPEDPQIAPDPLAENSVTFVDRTHVYADIPEFIIGAQYVILANDNKNMSAYELDLTFGMKATLYVFVDNRMGGAAGGKGVNPNIDGMGWLTDMGFVDTGEDIGIDESFDGDIDQYFSIFSLAVDVGTVTIHGNTEGHGGNMLGVAALGPKYSAYYPVPEDGGMNPATWVSLAWTAGDTAATHDVYFSDNFDDVNDGTGDAYRGNQTNTDFLAGFTDFPFPDGLVPGATYYWRIDEIEADGTTLYRGNVWSFTVPPKTAYAPIPADGAELVDLDVRLTWTPGFGAKIHYVSFGENFDDVNNAVQGTSSGTASFNPGPLQLAKTYYWRVDEFEGPLTHRGEVWSFTTEGAVSGPNPANGAVNVSPTQILTWDAGAVAASHEVYFGMDADAVKNATKGSPEYKGPKALGEESYDPGKLMLNTAYYWRIDEVNGTNPDSPWAGNVWSFTTGDFFVIDDFEAYNADDNQIWFAWHDGLGAGVPGVEPYVPGNGTGAAVGDETTASYTEETIVHSGGSQSMPYSYDNNKQGFARYSEAELTLSAVRDWTAEGVAELSIWFRGNPASVGSFIEGPVGTYTMTSTGADIWNAADQFHYAFKTLTGVGSIVAKVLSVDNTDPWAKAGVMIRETLGAGSKFAAVYITPGNGCRFQARSDTEIAATSDSGVVTTEQTAIVAPYWVKLERDFAGNFRGFYSANGSTWTPMAWNPQNISMSSTVYIGLAVTSHNNNAVCQVQFSNVTTTGNVTGQWMNQDIGIVSNDAEPLYVAVSNSTGNPAVVIHNDAAAANINVWTEWVIPLSAFADQGINLANVDRIAIGLGTRGNVTTSGGKGKMYIDDIRLYRSR